MSNDRKGEGGPVLFDLEDTAAPSPSPAEVAPVPELQAARAADGQAMQTVAALASRRPSRLARWFWGLVVTLVGVVAGVAAWDFATAMLVRHPVLGYAVTALMALLIAAALGLALRELAAFSRLRRVDAVHRLADEARSAADLGAARRVSAQLMRLYKGRDDTSWGRRALAEVQGDALDADALLDAAERHLMEPLDLAAMREIEAAARQVATVTAIVPLALADVVAALTSNIRMIRRIAEIYGGRSGALGSWRLTRAVMTHLVATGAVAVGDDLISSVAGGGVLGKISRRFGEGVVNGALTARVGLAAVEVRRPMPFAALTRPSVTSLVKRALTGLFGRTGE